MKKKQEETYRLTFRGFVASQMDMNEGATDHFLDALELWMRRTDENAVILTTAGVFETHKVHLEDK